MLYLGCEVHLRNANLPFKLWETFADFYCTRCCPQFFVNLYGYTWILRPHGVTHKIWLIKWSVGITSFHLLQVPNKLPLHFVFSHNREYNFSVWYCFLFLFCLNISVCWRHTKIYRLFKCTDSITDLHRCRILDWESEVKDLRYMQKGFQFI